MIRNYIQSSVIRSAGFDSKANILELEFHNDEAVWQYFKFPKHMYQEFLEAPSKGNFLLPV